MSTFGGSPINTSLLQAAQAQQVASKDRDRSRAADDRGRRYQDLVDLRVAGVESADAVRQLPQNDSEQAEDEHRSSRDPGKPERPHIDLTA